MELSGILKNKIKNCCVDSKMTGMKNFIVVFLFFTAFSITSTNGQTDFRSLEENLAFQADVMVNASKSKYRARASATFREAFKSVLEEENSFSYPFDSLELISKLYAPDSSFRIFTWQVHHSPNEVDYFGFIQTFDTLIILEDKSPYNQDLKYEVLGPDTWFGQIYYDVQTFTSKGQKHTLFFGARMQDQDQRIKTAEAIEWQGSTVRFGKELFYKQSRHGDSRLLLAYYAQSNAQLRYDPELGLIVFDHLIPIVNPYEKNKRIMVPDGTLEAYALEDGKWHYKEKVFDQKYDAPPIPEPILKDQKKDLFGR